MQLYDTPRLDRLHQCRAGVATAIHSRHERILRLVLDGLHLLGSGLLQLTLLVDLVLDDAAEERDGVGNHVHGRDVGDHQIVLPLRALDVVQTEEFRQHRLVGENVQRELEEEENGQDHGDEGRCHVRLEIVGQGNDEDDVQQRVEVVRTAYV